MFKEKRRRLRNIRELRNDALTGVTAAPESNDALKCNALIFVHI
jgi:hypothetical protein